MVRFFCVSVLCEFNSYFFSNENFLFFFFKLYNLLKVIFFNILNIQNLNSKSEMSLRLLHNSYETKHVFFEINNR